MNAQGGPETTAEFFALPEGEEWSEKTDEHGRRVPTLNPAVAFFVSSTLVVGCADENGVVWKLGRCFDGSWFRQRRFD